MSTCGLSDSQLSDPDARVPFTTQEQLWQQLSRIEHADPGLQPRVWAIQRARLPAPQGWSFNT